jgi:hypothetical protein
LWLLIILETIVVIYDVRLILALGRLADAFGVSLFANWRTIFLVLVTVAYAVDIVAPVALLQWRKWGFWYVCGLTGFAFIADLVIGDPFKAVMSLVALGILYGMLQIGGQKRVWPQLT